MKDYQLVRRIIITSVVMHAFLALTAFVHWTFFLGMIAAFAVMAKLIATPTQD